MSHKISRLRLGQSFASGLGAACASAGFPTLPMPWRNNPDRKRHCILLWMSGGPSQTDTFDLKPNHENGGEFKEIQTKVPGLRFSETTYRNLPRCLTSWRSSVGCPPRRATMVAGTYLMRTGHKPMGPERYPSIGSFTGESATDEQS